MFGNDPKTLDLLGDCDLAGPGRAVGVPMSKAAARAERYRQKHGVKPMTVNIPVAVLAEFESWVEKHQKNKSAVIAKLIQAQILRKR